MINTAQEAKNPRRRRGTLKASLTAAIPPVNFGSSIRRSRIVWQQHQKKQDCARSQRPMHRNFGGIDIADQADIDGNKPP